MYRNLSTSDGPVYIYDSDSGDYYTPYEDLTQLIVTLNVSSDTTYVTEWPTIIDINEHLREIVVEVATGMLLTYIYSLLIMPKAIMIVIHLQQTIIVYITALLAEYLNIFHMTLIFLGGFSGVLKIWEPWTFTVGENTHNLLVW